MDPKTRTRIVSGAFLLLLVAVAIGALLQK
ncbi:hypothetical protein FHR34_003080 [Kitasatospora kifunensis]|uniref:Uncharacterized protein n=1 Tax=Kitasatospora kifunensis TaxID=58351 RepID=A0A7W7VV71_KITKI|nr:hypothetical protein [Kitasatospora kifunensis]